MKRISSALFICIVLLLPQWGYAHARLTSPAPRNNNAGIKTGPCGGLPRSTSPLTLQGGQTLSVSWEETINHPGKFIFSLSMANDTNFNVLAQVPDTMNSTNDLPHRYTTQIQIPNVNCETCTLQMIQSMEENPLAPTYYYSCADIRIVASDTTVTTLSANGSSSAPNASFGGGCGLIKSSSSSDSGDTGFWYLWLAPVLLAGLLKRRYGIR